MRIVLVCAVVVVVLSAAVTAAADAGQKRRRRGRNDLDLIPIPDNFYDDVQELPESRLETEDEAYEDHDYDEDDDDSHLYHDGKRNET